GPTRSSAWSSLVLHGESQTRQHLDGAGLAALEVTGGKPLTSGQLVRRAQDCLRRVSAVLPDQLVRRRRSETVLGEELLGSEPVVLGDRAHYVVTAHLVPRDGSCHLNLSSADGGNRVTHWRREPRPWRRSRIARRGCQHGRST